MSSERNPRALFFFSALNYLRENEPVVHLFAARGWETRVVFGLSGPEVDQYVRSLEAAGIPTEVAPNELGYGRQAHTPLKTTDGGAESNRAGANAPASLLSRRSGGRILRLLWVLNRRVGLARLAQICHYIPKMLRIRAYGRALVDDFRPDAVLQSAYHSFGQIDNAISQTCKRRGIRRYSLSSSAYLGGCSLRVGRLNHLITGMAGPYLRVEYDLLNRMLGALFPNWTRTLADGATVFFSEPVWMLAAKLTGLFYDRPWTRPDRDSDGVFAFSEYARSLVQEDGFPDERIHVVGQPLMDSFLVRLGTEAHAKRVYDAIGLAAGTPFLLFNVEPAAEHNYRSWEKHRHDVRVLIRACAERGLPVVLSLHPLCREEEYRFAETEYGARICRELKIHEIYPYCGISVSFPCSTNLLAEPFGRPLVIYDIDRLTVRDSDSARLNLLPNAGVALEPEDLADVLARVEAAAPISANGARSEAPASERILAIVAEETGIAAPTTIGRRTSMAACAHPA